MKMVIITIITVVMIFALCACKDKQPDMLRDSYGEERFVKISSINDGTDVIYVDKETGVEYWFHQETAYKGGLTPILNKDGKPIIYQGEY